MVMALSPWLVAYNMLDSSVSLEESTGQEGVQAPLLERGRGEVAELLEPSAGVDIEAVTETVLRSVYEQSLLLPTHVMFFVVSFVVALIVARPLEKRHIIFDIRVKGGKVRAVGERMAVSFAITSLILSIASVPVVVAVYSTGAFASLAQSLAFSLSWLLGLSLISVSLASAVSVALKSVTGVLLASFLAVWASLIYSATRPLGSPLETYGLFFDFYGNYEPGLYAAVIIASLAACYAASLRLEV
jgi:hypothetical protein